jgi:hypothetical protein
MRLSARESYWTCACCELVRTWFRLLANIDELHSRFQSIKPNLND